MSNLPPPGFSADDWNTISPASRAVILSLLEKVSQLQAHDELALLYEAGRDAAASLDLYEVAERAAKHFLAALGGTSAYVITLNESGSVGTTIAQCISPDAATVERISDDEMVFDLSAMSKGLAVMMAGQHSLVSVDDPTTDDSSREFLSKHGIKTALRVPLIVASSGLVGYVVIWESRAKRVWTPNKIRLAQTMADRLAIAFENARLFEQTRTAAEETSRLYRASRAMVEAQTFDDVLAAVIEFVTALKIDHASISLATHDPGSDWLEVRAVWHTPGQLAPRIGSRWRLSESILEPFRRAGSEAIAVITDAASDERLPPPAREFMAERQMRATVLLPIRTSDHLIGVIGLFWARPRQMNPAELSNLKTLADIAASNIEKLRLLEETRQRNEELTLLYEAGRDATSSLQLIEVAGLAAKHLVGALSATSAYVLTLDEGRALATVVAQYISLQAAPGEQIMDMGATYDLGRSPKTLAAMTAGLPFVTYVSDPDADEMSRKFLAEHGGKVAFRVPLLAASHRLLGYVVIWESRNERRWTPHEVRLAQTLADRLATAIENAQLFGEVQRLAVTDGLTGLNNRRHFFELAEREFERARRYGRPLSAVMLDIDHFKRVNDVYGHALGDQVLRTVALRCRENLRDIDLLGRYGGEEFAALLPENDLEGAFDAAERLRRCVSDKTIGIDTETLSITISLGVAYAEGLPDLTTLLSQADAAMYVAKSTGRNQARRYDVGSRHGPEIGLSEI